MSKVGICTACGERNELPDNYRARIRKCSHCGVSRWMRAAKAWKLADEHIECRAAPRKSNILLTELRLPAFLPQPDWNSKEGTILRATIWGGALLVAFCSVCAVLVGESLMAVAFIVPWLLLVCFVWWSAMPLKTVAAKQASNPPVLWPWIVSGIILLFVCGGLFGTSDEELRRRRIERQREEWKQESERESYNQVVRDLAGERVYDEGKKYPDHFEEKYKIPAPGRGRVPSK